MSSGSTAMHLKRNFQMAPPRWLFFVMFTVSGFSGLIYESIWSHYLKLFLGHAAYAQSLVLMIFMGGMAGGSWIASRYSHRWKAPLVAYAIVEVIIKEAKIIGQTKIQQWIEKVVKFLSIWVPAPKLPSNCIQFNPIRIIIPRIIMEAINIVDR